VLIAEIGNNHFGDFKKAKELIRVAHLSGADLVKGQAFKAEDIKGSMPEQFYRDCEFTIEQHLELIDYARDLGNDLFYSIFSKGFEAISMKQNWHKIAGVQTRRGMVSDHYDIENMIISIPAELNLDAMPKLKRAEFLYVSEYCVSDPDLDNISLLALWLGRRVGYSDHTKGIKYAKLAYSDYGAHIIEKHFCLKKNQIYSDTVFRDTVHGANPKELEMLAIHMSK
jgi:N-acetylneuraminate synthase